MAPIGDGVQVLYAEGWPVELVSENIAQFGYSPEEFISGAVSYASIVHPDDLERVGRYKLNQKLGLDKPLWEQYAVFLKGAVTGDLGRSFVHATPALGLILQPLPMGAVVSTVSECRNPPSPLM